MALTETAHSGTIAKAAKRPIFGGFEKPARFASYVVAFDASYPTGGETFAGAADFTVILGVIVAPRSGYVFDYDYTNNKILAYYGDNNNASDGALIEVPNTTDLSTITGVRVLVWGY